MNRPTPWRSIMDSVVDRRPFSVGRATVDPVSRDARWEGGEERLQPQTLKVLLTLVSHRGEVVTSDDLIQLCWDGRIVGDDVINRSISLLRHFAERAGGFEIQTVPRTGYRLIERHLSVRAHPNRRWIAAAIAAPLILGSLAAWLWLNNRPDSQGVPPTPRISVMPFTADANDPLARQIALAAPISLERMMADSGFANVHGGPPAAANGEPNSYVFEGNVRHTATSVEATVQLVSKRDGTIVFTHDFTTPLDRATDLPDRIGAAVAAELAWTGAQMALDPREHLNPEITSELMNTLVLTIESRDRLRAYQLARHAAASAPDSAFAQLTLAMTTGFSIASIPEGERAESLALGRRASERALALAPEFGDVYLPWCLLHSPVQMVECDARVRHALQVDASSSFPPGFLSALFFEAGRMDESLPLAQQSLANDPYKPAKLARLIRTLEAAGKSTEAEQTYKQAIRLWPDDYRMRASRLLGMAERGNYAGLAAFADPATDGPMIGGPVFTALLAAQRNHDLAGAQRACDTKGITDFTQALCMTVLADLGDRDRSFAIAAGLYPGWHAPAGADEDRFWLQHPGGFDAEAIDGPAGQAMRTDPRFLEIAQRLGLLDYWRKVRLPDFCTEAHEPVCARITGKRS